MDALRRRGFTLIEALIAAAVIALLAVSSFPFLRGYQTQLDLEEAALALQSCLQAASDYARAPSAGATAYRATLRPASQTCTVERIAASTDPLDETTLSGVEITNSAGVVVDSFSLIVSTDLLHTVTYETVSNGQTGAAFPGGTVSWLLRPEGQSAPEKSVTVDLTHGVVTLDL